MSDAKTTTDHDVIRAWVEARKGHPATVKKTGSKNEPGILRIDFEDGEKDENLERISWDDFFAKFDEAKLAFIRRRPRTAPPAASTSSSSAEHSIGQLLPLLHRRAHRRRHRHGCRHPASPPPFLLCTIQPSAT